MAAILKRNNTTVRVIPGAVGYGDESNGIVSFVDSGNEVIVSGTLEDDVSVSFSENAPVDFPIPEVADIDLFGEVEGRSDTLGRPVSLFRIGGKKGREIDEAGMFQYRSRIYRPTHIEMATGTTGELATISAISG